MILHMFHNKNYVSEAVFYFMIGVLGHDSALKGYTGPGKTWANEMKFVMNHAPGGGSIARHVGQQSSVLPLNHGCPQYFTITVFIIFF